MVWDFGNPIALGLFFLMVGGALVLAAAAIAIGSGKAKLADFRVLNLLK